MYIVSNQEESVFTDNAVKQIMNGEDICINTTDNWVYIYSGDENWSIQLFLDYIHGKIENHPSLVISKDGYRELPFCLDQFIDIIRS